MLSRVASGLQSPTNPLYQIRNDLQARGESVRDLVSSNVNEAGIVFPEELLEEIVAGAAKRTRIYRPDSLGHLEAREAISEFYGREGVRVPPEHILLTPGTSVAYWYLFKLLADEGDEILAPRPSYPLFDYIAALSGVNMIPYRLVESREWAIDLEYLEAMISTRTRAIVLISPHNPTGHVSSRDENAAVAAIARRHHLAVISDEVFSEFLLDGARLPRAAAHDAALAFTLNGFSKMFALPGLKLGWIAVSGESKRVADAMSALELISDAFLPVAEVTQAAVPSIFERGASFLSFHREEVRRRWEIARMILSASRRLQIIEPRGGFYIVGGLSALDEERAAEDLLRREAILVHPGHYYDIEPDHLVFAFTHRPEILREALGALTAALETL